MTTAEPMSAADYGVAETPSSDALAIAKAVGRDTSAVSAYARERYEAEGAIIMARQFPRSEPHCRMDVLRACNQPLFAQLATYSFPMGGETIEGPSVALAREMARIWGHIASGFRVLSTDTERCEMHIQGFAIDYQTGTRRFEEARVRAKVWRKKEGRWIDLLDENEKALSGDRERQLALLIGRTASKLERNCLIRLMPAHLVDEAMEMAQKRAREEITPEKAAEAIERMARIGVTKPMLEAWLGTAVERASMSQLVELVKIGRSIAAKESTVEDWFDDPTARKAAPAEESEAKPSRVTKQDKLKPQPAVKKEQPKAAAEETEPEAEKVAPLPEEASLADHLAHRIKQHDINYRELCEAVLGRVPKYFSPLDDDDRVKLIDEIELRFGGDQ